MMAPAFYIAGMDAAWLQVFHAWSLLAVARTAACPVCLPPFPREALHCGTAKNLWCRSAKGRSPDERPAGIEPACTAWKAAARPIGQGRVIKWCPAAMPGLSTLLGKVVRHPAKCCMPVRVLLRIATAHSPSRRKTEPHRPSAPGASVYPQESNLLQSPYLMALLSPAGMGNDQGSLRPIKNISNSFQTAALLLERSGLNPDYAPGRIWPLVARPEHHHAPPFLFSLWCLPFR